MPTPRLKPAQQRAALRVLGRDRLRDLTDYFELEVGDKRVIDNHLDALVKSRRVDFADVLALLLRDELKAICEALGLDTSGKAKEPIIQRILDAGSARQEEESVRTTKTPSPPVQAPIVVAKPPAGAPVPQRGATTAQVLPERPPKTGELVQVRSRRWLVEEVVEPDVPGQSPLVRLACADDDAQGQALDVFWNYEPDRRILEKEGWSDLAAKGFDPPRQFGAFLHTLRWNCVTATDPNLFQAPFRAGIKIDAINVTSEVPRSSGSPSLHPGNCSTR